MRKAWIALAISALVLAGCGGDDAAEDDTPAPGAQGGTTMGGDHAGHGGGGNASCNPSGTTLSVVASGTKFNSDCFAAPADRQFTLNFENKDNATHNLVFLESHTATQVMFRADVFQGPATKTFTVGPFKAGTYAFHCEVHPSIMQGTFVVK
jgi:plastocyanin